MKQSTISDINAEAGIIATLLYNPIFITHSEELTPSHFYYKDTQCLYWAIHKLINQGVENIDSFNLETMINSDEGIKNTYQKYGAKLSEYVELSKNVARYSLEEYKILVKRVLSLSFKRDLHKQLNKFNDICLDVNQDDVSKLNSDIFTALNKLNEEYILNDEIKPLSEELDRIWEEIVNDSTEETSIILPKIDLLRNYYTYSKGEVIMLVARYKQGKSAYLLNECLYQAQQGHKVAYFDSEMSTKEFTIRALANLSGIDVRKIKDGSYSSSELQKLKESLSWLKEQNITHKYKPNWTDDDIFSAVKILQNKQRLDFLIFDYIKSNDGDANAIYNALGKKADYLKNMIAGNLKIPILTASQLNRNNEISDSDKLARYVSTVVYWKQKSKSEINGEDIKRIGNYTMQVRTNRLGEQMLEDEYIHVVFDGNKMNIYQAPEQTQEDDLDL